MSVLVDRSRQRGRSASLAGTPWSHVTRRENSDPKGTEHGTRRMRSARRASPLLRSSAMIWSVHPKDTTRNVALQLALHHKKNFCSDASNNKAPLYGATEVAECTLTALRHRP